MGDLQILIQAILAENSEKAIDSTLKNLVERLGNSHEIKLKVGIDKDSSKVIQSELQTIAKQVAFGGGSGSSGNTLQVFNAAKLQKDGRKYYAATQDIVSQVKREYSRLGKTDVTNVFKDSHGNIRKFTVSLTDANGVVEKFNYKLAKVKGDSDKAVKSFVQMNSVLTDKNVGSNLEKQLDFVSRINKELNNNKSSTLVTAANPLQAGSAAYTEYNRKLAAIQTRMSEVTSNGKIMSASHKREIQSMVADLKLYSKEQLKLNSYSSKLKANTFDYQKKEWQKSLEASMMKWENSGLVTDNFRKMAMDAKSALDSAFDGKGLDVYKHKLALVNSEFRKLQQGNKKRIQLIDMDKLESDISSTRKGLLNLRKDWSAFTTDPRLNAKWQDIFDFSGTVKSRKDLQLLKSRITDFRKEVELAGKNTKTFGDRFKDSFQKIGNYILIDKIISGAITGVQSLVTAVTEVDTAMVELKKVTNETDAAYDKFLTSAAKKAVQIGTTYSDFITSTSNFARLGYSMAEAEQLAEVATIYSVVGDEIDSVETATSSIISTMKAFNIETQDAMKIVDKFNAVGNNFSISSGGIGDALTRSASSMAAANNTLDQTIALITAANNVVQDPESVGTAFKTISMRIRGAKTELEEAGLETEGMAESTATLRKEIMALSGVDIMLDENTFKSTYQIMDELAAKWKDLTDIERATITELIAGKRQGNVVSSLMTNFDTARAVLETSMNSDGSAMQEHEKWLDSIQAKQQQFQAQYQAFATAILSSDLVKGVYSAGTGILGFLTEMVETVGLLGTLTAGGGIVAFIKNMKDLSETGSVLSAIGDTTKSFKDIGKSLTGMDMGKVAKAMQSAGVGADDMKSALRGMGATGKEAAEVIASLSNDGLKMGNVFTAVGAKIKGAGKAIKGAFTSLMANPAALAAIAAAIAAIGIAAYAHSQSFEHLSEKAAESKSALQETTTELQSMQTELESNANKIKELQALEAPSVADEQEIVRLQLENTLLEAQIKLKQQVLEAERQQAAKDANKALTTGQLQATGDFVVLDAGYQAPTFESKDFIEQVQDAQSELDGLKTQYEDILTEIDRMEAEEGFDASDKTYQRYVESAERLRDRIATLDGEVAADKLTLLGLYTSLLDGNGEVYEDYVDTAKRIEELIDVGSTTDAIEDSIESVRTAFNDAISGMSIGDADKTGIMDWFGKLSEEDQKIAYEILCDSDGAIQSVEAFQNALADTKLEASRTGDAIKSALSDATSGTTTLLNNFNAVTEQITSLGTGQSISLDAYNSEELRDYADALEYTNGCLQLNAERVNEIAKAKAEEQIAINNSNKAIAQSKYLENARQIRELRAELNGLSDDRQDEADSIRAQIAALESENSQIKNTCAQYDLMTASILEATGAYQHWLNAQNAAQTGDMFDGALGAMQHINDTLNNKDSEFYGRIGRSDYKAAVDFIVPDSVDRDDADAVNAYMKSITGMFTKDSSGNITGLNIANFCQKAVDAGLMVLNEAGTDYEIAGGKTMEDFAKGLGLSLPLVQAMFGELQEFGAEFDWADEGIKTMGDLAVSATDAADALKGIQGSNLGHMIIDVSHIEDAATKVSTLQTTINDVKKFRATLDVDSTEYQQANQIIEYCMRQQQQIQQPVIMRVDTSMMEGKMADAIALLQDYIGISNEIAVNKALGLDTTELETQLSGVESQIAALDPNVKISLGINDATSATLASQIAAIDIPKLTAECGVDDKAIIGYVPENKKANVEYGVDDSAVRLYDPPNLERTVTYTVKTVGDVPSGGTVGVNGTAHVSGTAHAGGDWRTKVGGRKLTGELGREIVVDPKTGRWYTVGDRGAEFVDIPKGSIIFNHKQTEALLRYGYVAGRGNAMVSGSAAVTGSIPVNKWTTGKPSGSGGSSNSGGGSSSSSSNHSSSSSSDSSEDEYNPFEEAYKRHQHYLAMEQESLKDYLNWLEGAYKDAYKSGYIELDDLYKYEEEVYEGRKELFDDYLNDMEHKISMMEREHGRESDIINLYLDMFNDIQSELNKAYARGLTNNDEYVQELLDRQLEYADAIKEIREDATDDAKSAVKDLVDYRIDMIKQELENEKDALNDRIDTLRDFYDEQKKLLEDARDEEQYLEEQSEKRKAKSDIEAELEQLRYDDSAWAQKRKLELQAELSDADKELQDFEKDHAYGNAVDLLDKMYEQQEAQIKTQIDAIDEKLNDPDALYNQALRDIQNNTEQLYQAMVDYNNDYGDGNPETVKEMWDEARESLDNYLHTFGQAYKNILLVASTNYGVTGYASGTRSATAGLHKFDEGGNSEYVFAKRGDKYRIFSSGDKVLNSEGADFLYDFGNSGGGDLISRIKSVLGGVCDNIVKNLAVLVGDSERNAEKIRQSISNASQDIDIQMGDIIVQGNADEKTVSAIRREKRESVDYLLKQFAKLNK